MLAAVHLDFTRFLFLAVAGFGAGIVNGVAGGGQLLSFPALLAVGYPALTANVTSTVSVLPSYLGGVAGFKQQLGSQKSRVRELAPVSVAGAVTGIVLLLTAPSRDFRLVVPYLILMACALFSVQPLISKWLRNKKPGVETHMLGLRIGSFLSAAYGSYLGAAMGVILLSVYALTLPDDLQKLNGLRSVMSLGINTLAAIIFIFVAPIAWTAAASMVGFSLAGGFVGSHFARRLPPAIFRVIVILIGVISAVRLLGA